MAEQPEPYRQAGFGGFEPSAGPAEQPEPYRQAGFGGFEASAGPAEQPEPYRQTGFDSFEPAAGSTEKPNTFRQNESGVVEFANGAGEKDNGRSLLSGNATPTSKIGAFASMVDVMQNGNDKIREEVVNSAVSLLGENESSALADGLPDWDIIPPQIVVRRKRRI